jgi:hypothetical protein
VFFAAPLACLRRSLATYVTVKKYLSAPLAYAFASIPDNKAKKAR